MKRSKKNWWEINSPSEMGFKNLEPYNPKNFRRSTANHRRKKTSIAAKNTFASISKLNNWQRFLRWLRSYF